VRWATQDVSGGILGDSTVARWIKGQSGNRNGRPREATAIAGLARSQLQRHKLVEKLGRIAARQGEYGNVDVDQQMRAIQLLLSYGYGPPRGEHEGGEGVVIQVNYVERNPIGVTGATRGAAAGGAGGQTVQCGLLRAPVGKDGLGYGSGDPPSARG